MMTIEPPVRREPETGYALCAGQLFDGRETRGPGAVVVEKGRITGVHTPVGALSDGLEVIDLGHDVTLLPGLIDPHVHLVLDASPGAVENVQSTPDDKLPAQMRDRARSMLSAGLTTVRDLGDRRYLTLPLRDELAGQLDAGPQLLCAGPPITRPGGHCWFLGGEAASHEDLRAAVAERAAQGADAVKVMVTGGEITPGSHLDTTQFDRSDLAVVVSEARRRGLPVAAHAHGPEGIAGALAAGVDTIEHCTFVVGEDIVPDDDLIRAIAAAGVIVSFTLGFGGEGAGALPARIRALLPKIADVVGRVISAGGRVTVGSDAGIGPLKPHDVLPHGAVVLADICGDARAALAAVTSTAATACRVAQRKGALAVGYDADLLAVRGDPAADIRVLHDVVAVYRAGVRVGGVRQATSLTTFRTERRLPWTAR